MPAPERQQHTIRQGTNRCGAGDVVQQGNLTEIVPIVHDITSLLRPLGLCREHNRLPTDDDVKAVTCVTRMNNLPTLGNAL